MTEHGLVGASRACEMFGPVMVVGDFGGLALGTCALLVIAGFVAHESGVSKAKHSVNAAAKALVAGAITTAVVYLFGHALVVAPSLLGVVGLPEWRDIAPRAASMELATTLSMALAATAILAGAPAERMSFRAYAALTGVFAGLVFPLALHWVAGGSAASPGVMSAIGLVDPAGAAAIHIAGGAAALAAAIVVGPRIGRFEPGRAPAIQNQAFPFAALGAVLLWLGWTGFAVILAGDRGAGSATVVTAMLLAGAGGVLAGFVATQVRPDMFMPPHLILGLIAGCISMSAGASLAPLWAAPIVGAIAGAAALGFGLALTTWRVDDVTGMAGVHLTGGAIALAFAGVLAPGASPTIQIGAGLLVATFAFGAVLFALKAIGSATRLRVGSDEERIGLNISEHRMTTDVALLVARMQAAATHRSSFAYVEADVDGELAQVANEFNRAVDLFRAEIEQAVAEIDRVKTLATDAEARAEAAEGDLAISTEKLQAAARDVAALAEHLSRAMVMIEGLQTLRGGLVKILGDAFRAPIEDLARLAKHAAGSRDPGDIDRLVEQARERSVDLARRLADVLEFAEASGLDGLPRQDALTAEALVRRITMDFRPRAERRGLRFRAVWEPEAAELAAHGPALTKVAARLVGAAINATPEGGLVSFLARRREDGGLALEVVDTGPGLMPGALARALDPMNADASEGGAHLGMAVAKRLAELLGGTLTIRSKPGVGTQATIDIPPQRLLIAA